MSLSTSTATAADSSFQELFFAYKHKTPKEHILTTPDTYLGSIEPLELSAWIASSQKQPDETVAAAAVVEEEQEESSSSSCGGESNGGGKKRAAGSGSSSLRIIEKQITYIPGFYKLFDETVVNCRDHVVRMRGKIASGAAHSIPVTYIDVEVDAATGTITMTNDGNGMDVVKNEECGVWVPEHIFATLLTSTNYDESEEKIVGGKNGYGVKLVYIWSTYGRVETVDHIRGLKYVQEYRDNLDVIVPPVITKVGTPSRPAKPYTKITFRPDYERLGMTPNPNYMSDDVMGLLRRRVMDIAALTDANVKVRFNGEPVPVRSFETYVNLYIGDKSETARVYEQPNERWEYAVAISPSGEFTQVSFVNGIHTSKGGKHVEYILGQITRKLVDLIEKKKKVKVNANSIKEQLMLFLRCDIVNPGFEGQTKDCLNTPVAKFGSRCDVSDKFIEKLAKLGGVVEAACAITDAKEAKVAARKTDGAKVRTVRGIAKLDDANYAGTERSGECTLILCEGDSAKSGILSGMSREDRDWIGVFPLKGKMINVRGMTETGMSKNEEIAAIKKIMGLEANRTYATWEDVHRHLRYGRICIMTDQDLDGSHIKGLGINFIHHVWPSLARLPGFLCFMNTPILKAKRAGRAELCFYNQGEYLRWKEATPDADAWSLKYYKGLGTSNKAEFQDYFKEKKYVGFTHTPAASDDAIDMMFNKKRADDRKALLRAYDRNRYLDTSRAAITYEEFVHDDLVHFSMYDCDRSIPSVVDGLKPSQRKVLYCAFKRRLTSEIKVAQFTGYVSEHAAYHHGEASLCGTIIGMAQDFVGSNNLPLLEPLGQFGTRLLGGKDAASPRYIFTRLQPLTTRRLFPEPDDAVLRRMYDDGEPVEPVYYVPVLPLVLLNGATGIGTGTSTDIACYHPREIAAYLRGKLQQQESSCSSDPQQQLFVPYYEGFQGTTTRVESSGATHKFVYKGKYHKTGTDQICITELPVGTWTDTYRESVLDKLMEDKDKEGNKVTPVVRDVRNNYTDSTVEFYVTLSRGKLDELETSKPVDADGCNGVEQVFKLYSTHRTSNMNLYNADGVLQTYETVPQIIDAFFEVRLRTYDARKAHCIAQLEQEVAAATEKAKFIEEVRGGHIDLRKSNCEIVATMRKRGFVGKEPAAAAEADEESTTAAAASAKLSPTNPFEHLLRLPVRTLSEESIAKLRADAARMQAELDKLRMITTRDMWLADLDAFEAAYTTYLNERAAEKARMGGQGGGSSKQQPTKGKKKAVAMTSTDAAAAAAPKAKKQKITA